MWQKKRHHYNYKCADYNTVKLYESSQFIKAGLSYRF